MSIVTKGDLSPRVITGTEITLSVDGDSGTVVLRGEYSQLQLARPLKGSDYTHDAVEFVVVSTKLTKDRGDLGTLTITLGDKSRSGTGSGDGDEPNETTEIEYTLIEKPLEAHPLFEEIFNGTNTTAFLEVKLWEAMPDEDANQKFLFMIPDGSGGFHHFIEEIAKQFCRMKAKGIDAYLLQVPVVRLTTTISQPVYTSSAGMRDAPPKFGSVAPAWLKTDDKMQRSGSRGAWQRVEEWTGFDTLDETLYPISPP